MLFVVLFQDNPDRLSVRAAFMTAHLAYLDTHRDTIRVAGSLRTDPDVQPLGACWIVEAPDRGAAEALCHDDPFWKAGLRAEVKVLHWSKAFADRLTPV
jgi:uncharacterized protein YciI